MTHNDIVETASPRLVRLEAAYEEVALLTVRSSTPKERVGLLSGSAREVERLSRLDDDGFSLRRRVLRYTPCFDDIQD